MTNLKQKDNNEHDNVNRIEYNPFYYNYNCKIEDTKLLHSSIKIQRQMQNIQIVTKYQCQIKT